MLRQLHPTTPLRRTIHSHDTKEEMKAVAVDVVVKVGEEGEVVVAVVVPTGHQDQVRNTTGGQMDRYLCRHRIPKTILHRLFGLLVHIDDSEES
jgi:hypothetical protein